MVFGRISNMFHKAYSNNLLATNVAMSGGLLFLGDVIQQKIELYNKVHDRGHYDWERGCRMLAMGIFHGAPRHFFYQRLEKAIPGKSLESAVKKVFFDQTVLSVFIDGTFLLGIGLLSGQAFVCSWANTKDKFPTVYLWDWLVWPPVQIINFTLVSLKFRVLFVNLMTVLWNTILSYAHYQLPSQ